MLTLDRVSVRYGSAIAVDEVSVAISAGQWAALIGANGAGKTSLLRAIAMLEGSQGEIRVGGHSISTLSHRRRAQLVAYVPQQPRFPAEMSVLDYALLGRTPYLGYLGSESAWDRQHCMQVLDRLELAAMARRSLASLSGGELQRAVLARALAQDAPVLILDEPTSALDLGRRIDVLELIDQLRGERELTVLSALHDLTLAAQFADRLLLLSHGTLLADGPPAEVLDEATLSACFGAQVQVLTGTDGELLVVPRRYHKPAEGRTVNVQAGTSQAGNPHGGTDD